MKTITVPLSEYIEFCKLVVDMINSIENLTKGFDDPRIQKLQKVRADLLAEIQKKEMELRYDTSLYD